VSLGTEDNGLDLQFDIQYDPDPFTGDAFSGEVGLTQLLSMDYSLPGETFSDERLDGAREFYHGTKVITSVFPLTAFAPFLDMPGNTGLFPVRVKGDFRVFCRFRPSAGIPADNIFVTLGILHWEMHGECSSAGPPEIWPTKRVPSPSQPDESDEFPSWKRRRWGGD
jgi:hypothetical protein